MKQQVYKPSHIFWSKLISFFITPFYKVLSRFQTHTDLSTIEVKSILITEYHRIGDVIIIEQALNGLRNHFPKAKLTLVCNPAAIDLAIRLNCSDSVVGLNAPWTNWEWSFSKWNQVRNKIKQLGSFDIAIDFKGDLRNNWLLWQSNSKIRLGYIATGGACFLTHPVEFPFHQHQTHRAISLISKLGIETKLSTPITKNNLSGSIVIHAGASDPKRSWTENKWVKLIESLSVNYHVAVVKTSETDGIIKRSENANLNFQIFEGNLISFANWLSKQRMLIAPDSMAGHLASREGIPLISMFGSQDPELTSPLGKSVKIVKPERPCNHKKSHWRLCEECIELISVESVVSIVKQVLSPQENEY